LAVILIALNPIAKYALTLNPVNLTWEIWLFSNDKVDYFCGGDKRKVIKIFGKLLVSTFVVTLAYLIPGFDKVMALLGAFFSVTISGSFPLLCHMKLFHETMPRWEMALNIVLFTISVTMAILGTAWSFL
jgi:amino acid permease